MKIAIIGAGPSGLVTTKYCIGNKLDCDVYEQRGNLGGAWNSDEEYDSASNIYASNYTTLYDRLITNIPKEIMMYPDFPYPPDQTKSFLEPWEVLNYFKSYADVFDIHPYIKYCNCVVNVAPNTDETWSLTIKNLKTRIEDIFVYDAVFICTGHLWHPFIPDLPGRDVFKGDQVHSSRYHKPDVYKHKTVVIVGARSSARDIALFISAEAKHVYVSYRSISMVTFGGNISGKPPIKELQEYSAVFEDSTEVIIDAIIYCTGFDYSFPFLSSECGITIEDNHMHPLYQHIINVNHPSMYFIGLPSLVCAIPMVDLQVRFCMAALTGKFKLPLKERTLKDLDDEMEKRKKLNIPKKFAHKMGELQEKYWETLANVASIDPLPPVLCRLYEETRKQRKLECRYRIIDNDNFEVY